MLNDASAIIARAPAGKKDSILDLPEEVIRHLLDILFAPGNQQTRVECLRAIHNFAKTCGRFHQWVAQWQAPIVEKNVTRMINGALNTPLFTTDQLTAMRHNENVALCSLPVKSGHEAPLNQLREEEVYQFLKNTLLFIKSPFIAVFMAIMCLAPLREHVKSALQSIYDGNKEGISCRKVNGILDAVADACVRNRSGDNNIWDFLERHYPIKTISYSSDMPENHLPPPLKCLLNIRASDEVVNGYHWATTFSHIVDRFRYLDIDADYRNFMAAIESILRGEDLTVRALQATTELPYVPAAALVDAQPLAIANDIAPGIDIRQLFPKSYSSEVCGKCCVATFGISDIVYTALMCSGKIALTCAGSLGIFSALTLCTFGCYKCSTLESPDVANRLQRIKTSTLPYIQRLLENRANRRAYVDEHTPLIQ